jgi:monofunctional biosynthetic peptidoglycan transglycosylase
MIAPPYSVPRRRRWAVWIAALFGLLLLWAAWQAITWPDVAALADENPDSTAFIDHYRGWGIFGGKREVAWSWVPYARISPNLKRAVLVSEDIGFFSHDGFATEEMRRALQDAWEEKTLPRGASTITQQLAKNLYLSPSRNPLRKVKEALLTRQLETELSKRRILEIYLNVAEMGTGIYGAEAAARHYFGKSARNLSAREAAQLAASLPYPAGWHPGSKSARYQRRVRIVLRRMPQAWWLNRRI